MTISKENKALRDLLDACVKYKKEVPSACLSGLVMTHLVGKITKEELHEIAKSRSLILVKATGKGGFQFKQKRGDSELICLWI